MRKSDQKGYPVGGWRYPISESLELIVGKRKKEREGEKGEEENENRRTFSLAKFGIKKKKMPNQSPKSKVSSNQFNQQ